MIYLNNVITRRVTVTRVIISESTQLISEIWEPRIIKRFDNASIESKDNYNDRHVALVFALLPAACRLYTNRVIIRASSRWIVPRAALCVITLLSFGAQSR